jgi:hypothetical protein
MLAIHFISLSKVVVLGSKLFLARCITFQSNVFQFFGAMTDMASPSDLQCIHVGPEVTQPENVMYAIPEEFSRQALEGCRSYGFPDHPTVYTRFLGLSIGFDPVL